MRIVSTRDKDFQAAFDGVRLRGGTADPKIARRVAAILADVRANGDRALFRLTRKYDGFAPTRETIEVREQEKRDLLGRAPADVLETFEAASKRIESFHRRQVSESWRYSEEDGIELGQIVKPLRRVGIYCPGGLAFYPSSVLMTAIPARVAGVKEIFMVTPARHGSISPLVIAAAKLAGVDRVFKIGGAQAIAALAYGTESVPRVDKIVGPGNAYVAAAKRMVFGEVGIDMIAGPSEICIIADGTADASMAAADLLSQAEHDEMAAAVFITPDRTLASRVKKLVEARLRRLSRADIAGESLKSYGLIIVAKDIDECLSVAADLAPEHLELMVARPGDLAGRIENAGAIFAGKFTPEAIGDYLAGPSHVLPTGGSARFSSPLGVYDFEKRMSFVSFSKGALKRHSPTVLRFAEMEGLQAHGESVRARFAKKS